MRPAIPAGANLPAVQLVQPVHPNTRGEVMRLSQALRCVTLLLLSAPALAAQETGRIVGKVIDQEHGTAIAGAVLEVDGTEIRAQSAIDGRYTLTREIGRAHV